MLRPNTWINRHLALAQCVWEGNVKNCNSRNFVLIQMRLEIAVLLFGNVVLPEASLYVEINILRYCTGHLQQVTSLATDIIFEELVFGLQQAAVSIRWEIRDKPSNQTVRYAELMLVKASQDISGFHRALVGCHAMFVRDNLTGSKIEGPAMLEDP